MDGVCVSSFTLGPDTAVGLMQHLGISPRWLDHIPMGGASGVVALRRAARALKVLPPLPAMRAILGHGAHRASEARHFRQAVSAGCALPVVELPVWSEGPDAEGGWRARCEAVLAAPAWPEAEDAPPQRSGVA